MWTATLVHRRRLGRCSARVSLPSLRRMRSPLGSRPDEHRAAVERRLAALGEEFAALRESPGTGLSGCEVGLANDHALHHDGDTAVPGPRTRSASDRAAPAMHGPVPVPGRHASRERGGLRESLGGTLPPTLRGRIRLATPHLAVVSVLVALGLVALAWFATRGEETTIRQVSAVPSEGAGALLATPAPGQSSEHSTGQSPAQSADPAVATSGATQGGLPVAAGGSTAQVTVDVAGKVRRPGIVVLRSGARVVDALQAAGGPLKGVDLSGLNQARVLVDGEQILVGEAAPVGAAASGAPAASPTIALVDLNSADQPTLETLPGVGPVTAQKILQWRAENGAFTAVDELLEIDGIGDATLAEIAPFVTV